MNIRTFLLFASCKFLQENADYRVTRTIWILCIHQPSLKRSTRSNLNQNELVYWNVAACWRKVSRQTTVPTAAWAYVVRRPLGHQRSRLLPFRRVVSFGLQRKLAEVWSHSGRLIWKQILQGSLHAEHTARASFLLQYLRGLRGRFGLRVQKKTVKRLLHSVYKYTISTGGFATSFFT